MGEVYIAAKPGPVGIGPYVALKILRGDLAADPQFVQMLVDEANISMFLNHQNVVSVLDLGEDGGRYYIAMEYVQGITVERLAETLSRRNETIPIPTSLFIAVELCRALKYAHTRVNHAGEPLNIIHRDVTPANILLSIQGEVKLTDFGIARARGRLHQTQAGVLKGKLGYVAPEMVRYEEVDARADLFCVGVVLYLMLCGQHPVAGLPIMEAIDRYETKKVPPPSSLNPSVPQALDTIIMRCLEPQPMRRWGTAAALGDALQDVLLQTTAWRSAAAKDGPRSVVEQIRAVASDAFEAPVDSATIAAALESVREAPADEAAAMDRPTEDVAIPIKPPAEPSSEPPDAGTAPEVDTDEGMPLAEVRDVQADLRPQADPNEAEPKDVHDGDGDETDAVPVPDRAPSDVTLSFTESSTDRRRLADALLAEPERPGTDSPTELPAEKTIATHAYLQRPSYEEPVIDRAFKPSLVDDATIVGNSMFAEDEHEVTIFDGGPSALLEDESEEEEDAAARAGHGPRTESLTAVVAAERSAYVPPADPTRKPDEGTFFDATVLDAVDADALREVAAQARNVSFSDRTLAERPGSTLDLTYTEDSATAPPDGPAPPAASRPPEPHVAGPLRLEPLASAEHSGDRRIDPFSFGSEPGSAREGAVSPKRPAAAGYERGSLGAGPETHQWLAGRLPAENLAWDDEAAARRAIATRNQPGTAPSPYEPEGASVAVPPLSPTPLSPTPQSAYGRTALPPSGHRAAAFRSRLGVPGGGWWVIALGVVAFVGLTSVFAYAWASSRVFWPKLTLESVPTGARVVVDGQTIPGETPVMVKVSPGNRHRVEFSLRGYRTEKREITEKVHRLGKYTLRVELSQRATRLFLSTEGTVFINGDPTATGREVLLTDLPQEGPVIIRIEAKGHYPYQARFESADQLPESFDVPLKPHR